MYIVKAQNRVSFGFKAWFMSLLLGLRALKRHPQSVSISLVLQLAVVLVIAVFIDYFLAFGLWIVMLSLWLASQVTWIAQAIRNPAWAIQRLNAQRMACDLMDEFHIK